MLSGCLWIGGGGERGRHNGAAALQRPHGGVSWRRQREGRAVAALGVPRRCRGGVVEVALAGRGGGGEGERPRQWRGCRGVGGAAEVQRQHGAVVGVGGWRRACWRGVGGGEE